jgi:hypothetical protein
MAGRVARDVLPSADAGAWAYDAGRRLALLNATDRIAPPLRPGPSRALVSAVIGAVGL